MKVRHGALRIDVPAGWSDESTLVFVAPTAPALPTKARNTGAPDAITVKLSVVPEGTKPKELLAERAAALAEQAEALVVLREGPITSGLGEGWSQVHRLSVDGGEAAQIVAVFVLGTVAVVGIAGCDGARLPLVERDLRAALESLATEA